MTDFLLFLILLKMPNSAPLELGEDEIRLQSILMRFAYIPLGIWGWIMMYDATKDLSIPIDRVIVAWTVFPFPLWLGFLFSKYIIKYFETDGLLPWCVYQYRVWMPLAVIVLLKALADTGDPEILPRALVVVWLTFAFCAWRAVHNYREFMAIKRKEEAPAPIMNPEPPSQTTLSPEETSQTQEPQSSQNMTASPTIDLTDDQISAHRITR